MNYGTWGYEDGLTILLSLIGFIIVIYAQIKVNSSYAKNSKIKSNKGLSGQEVARKILDSNGLNNIHIVEVKGKLTDHYDPSRKVLRLSHDIFNGDSIASVSVAAHECGHAIQDKDGYVFMRIRGFLVPIVNFVTYVGYFVAIVSIMGSVTGYLKVSLLIILAAVLFQLVTLPVEFDASNRAKEELLKLGLIDNEEQKNVKNMLGSAALTYVASLVSSILNVLRIIIMIGRRDD